MKLRVIADEPLRWSLASHQSVESTVWSAHREVSDLQSFDIGLMPLADSPWNRGKCGYKLLTYLACGVASLGSPVGLNVDILADDSLMPTTVKEWYNALDWLIEDSTARRRFAMSGRARTIDRFSVHALVPEFELLIREVSGI